MTFTNNDCGHRCAHPWRTVTLPPRYNGRRDERWTNFLLKDDHGDVNATDGHLEWGYCFNLFQSGF